MWTRAAVLSLLVAVPAWAEEPLSAIDWLSRSVEIQPQITMPGSISVEPLSAPPRAIGYIPPGSVGLSAGVWAGSDPGNLVTLLHRMPADLPLPLRDALSVLVALETSVDDPQNGFLLARIDALLALGRVDPAQRLIDDAGFEDPALFRRTFDIALLTGEEDAECRKLQSRPGIAPTYPTRIFCLARLGDWQAAALTLDNAEALAVLKPEEVSILSRFLHDGEEDLLPPPQRPATITPLAFRLYEAIGAPLSTRSLPLAFAHADLRHQNGWKTRLEAAERLYRAGAIPADVLLASYLERDPAASGGVWDRVAAVQLWQSAPVAERAQAAEDAADVLAPAGLARLLGKDASRERAASLDADASPDADLAQMIAEGREGEAALNAILRAADAWDGDHDDLSRAVATLDLIGIDLSGQTMAPQWLASQ